jgi:Chromo (CHRromatin Organisation MOdifier) domain
MPKFDEPFKILVINELASTITLELPPSSKTHSTFHTFQILPYKENDANLFPSREFAKPTPIMNEDGDKKYFVWDNINERRSGQSYKYLVKWKGYGDKENRWLPQSKLEDTEALDIWLS